MSPVTNPVRFKAFAIAFVRNLPNVQPSGDGSLATWPASAPGPRSSVARHSIWSRKSITSITGIPYLRALCAFPD